MQWWNDMTTKSRVLRSAGVLAACIVIGGGVSATAATMGSQDSAEGRTAPTAPDATETAAPTAPPGAVISTTRVDVTEPVAFTTETYTDPELDSGTSVVTHEGHMGSVVRSYDVVTADGVELRRVLRSEMTVVAPVAQEISVGGR
jgi:hypothetical protein